MNRPVFYGRRRRPWLVVAVVVAFAVALAVAVAVAVGSDGDSDELGSDAVMPETTVDPEPVMSHVHGLGVNPADGALYVATHYGLFRVTGHDDAVRVGSSEQDLMGFTVAGADRFLASGHPDIAGTREGLPTRLGLIESIDGGGTWRLVSLAGADLHALRSAHERAYGWDANTGRFVVSDDFEAWEERSTIQLHDFVVDPLDGDRIVASTDDGLMVSGDGGRSWVPTDGPGVVVLGWHRTGGLWGATAEGAVHRADDPDGPWRPVEPVPGVPHALTVEDGSVYAAAGDGERTVLVESLDGGSSWETIISAR